MKRNNIHFLTKSALFAAIMCILSPVTVAIGPVPVTMALFAVMLTSLILDIRASATAVLVYIFIGVCGLPVFAGGKGGFPVLAGPTGGYLWSYVITAVIISAFAERSKKFPVRFLGCCLGVAVCYFFGTVQYVAVSGGVKFATALRACVYPFIPFDILKSLCACLISAEVNKRLEKSGK